MSWYVCINALGLPINKEAWGCFPFIFLIQKKQVLCSSLSSDILHVGFA